MGTLWTILIYCFQCVNTMHIGFTFMYVLKLCWQFSFDIMCDEICSSFSFFYEFHLQPNCTITVIQWYL